MVSIKILKINGDILFEGSDNIKTIKEAVKFCVKGGISLHEADLSGVNLYGANLSRASLSGANLHGANLSRASLHGANLHGADLSGADLHGVNLYGANLSRASLSGANLHGADLHGADLYGADLHGADLSGANLHGADLSGADLHGADLSGVKNINKLYHQHKIIPDEGDIIGWKKCKNNVIVKLLIRDGVKRSNSFNRKCRAEEAEVLEIIGASKAYSTFDMKFEYTVGSIVKPTKKFNEDWWKDCESGIHFFITRYEAEHY